MVLTPFYPSLPLLMAMAVVAAPILIIALAFFPHLLSDALDILMAAEWRLE